MHELHANYAHVLHPREFWAKLRLLYGLQRESALGLTFTRHTPTSHSNDTAVKYLVCDMINGSSLEVNLTLNNK